MAAASLNLGLTSRFKMMIITRVPASGALNHQSPDLCGVGGRRLPAVGF
jgi:hypothetical protein